jgi:hypothetical protein
MTTEQAPMGMVVVVTGMVVVVGTVVVVVGTVVVVVDALMHRSCDSLQVVPPVQGLPPLTQVQW